MSVHVMKFVFEALLPDAATKLVALRLADFANRDGTSVFPSVAKIVNDTLLSERTVQRRLKVLIDLGVLRLVPRCRGRSTNSYAFDLAALCSLGSRESATSPSGRDTGSASNCQGDGAGVSARRGEGDSVTPNPLVNHHLTVSVTTRTQVDELQDQLIAAAGDAVDGKRVRKNGIAPVLRWLEAGLSLEQDILPAIAAKARTLPAGKAKAWLFFDGPVRDWHAQRKSERPAPAAGQSPETFAEADWQLRLQHYEATGRWHDPWGPEPGEVDCLVPLHLLIEKSGA